MSDTPILRALSVAVGIADSAPDGELLRRFAEAEDRTAFELVVRRHAELVWGVCRAALPRDPHAAEDAFQATFLILARKAAAVREGSAAGWLFRVARNVAVRARGRAARQDMRPLPDSLATASESVEEEATRREVVPVVAEEVDRLTATLRDPVVLCFFEGHTHAEAAERLGWPIGTVASRLARAKDVLRGRLTRRGVVLPAAGLGAIFTTTPVVTAAHVQTMLAVATGPADLIPPTVLSLTQGVLSAMRFTKIKSVAALVAIALGISVALAAAFDRNPQPPDAPPVPLPKPVEAPANAGVEKPDNEKRLKALQGKWRTVSDAMSAEVVAADPFRIHDVERLMRIVVTVVKDKMTTEDGEPADKFITEIRFPVDGGPQALDFITIDGPKEEIGTIQPAIYRLDGDRLTLCSRNLEHLKKGRPTAFRTDETQSLDVLERVSDEKLELKALAGEWAGRKFVIDDEEVTPDKDAKPKWIIDGAGVTFGGTGEPGEKATIKLDPNPDPPTIDLTVTRGGRTLRLVGIYSRQDDRLTVCLRDPQAKDTGRPTVLFPDDDVLYYQLERVAKK